MNKISKQAEKDAAEFARAQMFYGKGAGNRRKLIENTVAWKTERISGYYEAFSKALEKQNWADHAAKAMKERKRLDRSSFIGRNVRGLVNGNKSSMTTTVATVVTLSYYAHQAGLDKAAYQYGQKQYKKAKAWLNKQTTPSVQFVDSVREPRG